MKIKKTADQTAREPLYKRKNFQLYAFVLIALVLPFTAYVVFTLYPNLLSVYYSFFKWDGLSEKQFVGVDNFIRMFQDPEIPKALWHNLFLIITTIPLTMIIALILSDILVHKHFKENRVYKVLYFLPNVFSSVVVSLMWMFVYDGTFGMLNSVLRLLGIPSDINWLGNPNTALACMIPISVWCNVGFYVVIFTNAMRDIPKNLYEAAEIDGISYFQRFRKITLPLISGPIGVAILFLALGAIRGYETIMVMTQGGPAGATSVIGLYMFKYAFGQMSAGIKNYGYASAVGLLIAVILIAVKFIVDLLNKNKDEN